jgi:hypothetical protein
LTKQNTVSAGRIGLCFRYNDDGFDHPRLYRKPQEKCPDRSTDRYLGLGATPTLITNIPGWLTSKTLAC